MCFSSSASFAAAVTLSAIGTAALLKAKNSNQKYLAAVPIIFAVQQFCEGLLWLALTRDDWEFWKTPATYTFLIFAQVIWPGWVPFCIFSFNPSRKRNRFEKTLLVAGLAVSVYLGTCLIVFGSEADILGQHINYIQNYPLTLNAICSALYLFATIIPALMSNEKKMRLLGVAILLSAVVTEVFYREYFISVWCFFAAIISIIIFGIVSDNAGRPTATDN